MLLLDLKCGWAVLSIRSEQNVCPRQRFKEAIEEN